MDYSVIPSEELALICFQRGEESAWAEFVRRFHPLIARVVTRVARQWGQASPQLIDDLVQETYLKLCSDRVNLPVKFTATHKDAIFGYIKVVTANLVHDHFKASRSQKRDSAVTTSIEIQTVAHALEITSTHAAPALERTVLLQEIDACLQAVAPGVSGRRDRVIFWLYYRVGLPAREIAALSRDGLSTKGVESTLLRLNRQIRHRLCDKQSAVLPSPSTEKGKRSTESL
jgi:RNA polymerase sigma-70 factor (ECF subfamily)